MRRRGPLRRFYQLRHLLGTWQLGDSGTALRPEPKCPPQRRRAAPCSTSKTLPGYHLAGLTAVHRTRVPWRIHSYTALMLSCSHSPTVLMMSSSHERSTALMERSHWR